MVNPTTSALLPLLLQKLFHGTSNILQIKQEGIMPEM